LIAPPRVAKPPKPSAGPRLVLQVAIPLAVGPALGYALVLVRGAVNPNAVDGGDLEVATQQPGTSPPSRGAGTARNAFRRTMRT